MVSVNFHWYLATTAVVKFSPIHERTKHLASFIANTVTRYERKNKPSVSATCNTKIFKDKIFMLAKSKTLKSVKIFSLKIYDIVYF